MTRLKYLRSLAFLANILLACQPSTNQPTPVGVALPADSEVPSVFKVPGTQAVVYSPLGMKAGGYESIAAAKFPDLCTKGSIVPTTGALFPFSENQTLVVRGPLVMSDLTLYHKKEGATVWSRSSDLTTLQWQENNYGTIKSLGLYPAVQTLLENGREIFAALPVTGEILLVIKTKMPTATTPVYSGVSQNDVPAIWLLNSKIFQAPSGQYFCNCRGLGNPGGCGELDIAEIVPEKKSEVSTTIYSYEGARGAVLSKARPTTDYQIYGALLRKVSGAGEVQVLELDSFDFTATTLSDTYISQEWLPTAKRLNSGSETLNAP